MKGTQVRPRHGVLWCPGMMMRKDLAVLVLVILTSSTAVFSALGQESGLFNSPPDHEFQFSRLMYSGGNCLNFGYGWGRGSECVDWPDAEYHFMQGLTRLTRVNGAIVSRYDGEGGRRINLHDDSLFDFPWLYAVEVGAWRLDEFQATRLREYLFRGGFLMVDDFHGPREWAGFLNSMARVFPDRPVVEIPETDEVMHVLYDLNKGTQIPGIAALYNGRTWEKGGVNPRWRGIYDDQGRLVVAINFNMDLGDAWEHADTPGYPEPMTAMAYRFAVNYVIYAMTH